MILKNLLDNKEVDFTVENGVIYTHHHDEYYLLLTPTDKRESEIEFGHRYRHFKSNNKLYESMYTNRKYIDMLVSGKKFATQLSIFDFDLNDEEEEE